METNVIYNNYVAEYVKIMKDTNIVSNKNAIKILTKRAMFIHLYRWFKESGYIQEVGLFDYDTNNYTSLAFRDAYIKVYNTNEDDFVNKQFQACGFRITPKVFEYGWLDATDSSEFSKKYNTFVTYFKDANEYISYVFDTVDEDFKHVNIENYLESIYAMQDANTGNVDMAILRNLFLNTNQVRMVHPQICNVASDLMVALGLNKNQKLKYVIADDTVSNLQTVLYNKYNVSSVSVTERVETQQYQFAVSFLTGSNPLNTVVQSLDYNQTQHNFTLVLPRLGDVPNAYLKLAFEKTPENGTIVVFDTDDILYNDHKVYKHARNKFVFDKLQLYIPLTIKGKTCAFYVLKNTEHEKIEPVYLQAAKSVDELKSNFELISKLFVK